ncbi:MAG: ABC transporter ATP-binding protein [Planctomycetes bacterium]|nr:ABC transporter ATP-binding protein [Planctomycetota bacterium]
METTSAPLKRRKLRWLRVWRTFLPYARPHRKPLLRAALASAMVVGSRLAFPLPLRALLGPWLKSPEPGAPVSAPDDAMLLGLAFFGVVLALGVAEYLQRLQVAKFSIGWVRDIRAAAFAAANQVDPREMNFSSGDMVARLVGDTARLKAGLKGFLTHVATNGALFVGVTAIILSIDLVLGAVVAAAGALVLSVTWIGARRVYFRYLELRKKEGKLANRIQDSLLEDPREGSFARVNYSSGVHEATVVQLQVRTTLAAHTILALATLLSLWIGIGALESGRLSTDHLLTFFILLMVLHRPAVRLSRQGTRIGKMMACGERLERLIRAGREAEADHRALPPLSGKLKIKRLSSSAGNKDGQRLRVGPVSLSVPAGQKLALLGGAGSGKTTLLDLLAGELLLDEGKILWDGEKVHDLPLRAVAEQVGYLADRPFWMRRPVREVLGLPEGELPEEARAVLADCGAESLLRSLPAGIDTKIGPQELSRSDARRLALARILLGRQSLVLLDNPGADLTSRDAAAVFRRLAADPARTVVVAAHDRAGLESFDRFVELRDGQVVSDSLAAAEAAPEIGAG